MATTDDVRRIALSLPGVSEGEGYFAFGFTIKGKHKGFIWAWNERVEPKRARVPNLNVLAVRVASLSAKELLLASDTERFFTEPHYNGFPAILVRLEKIEPDALEELILEAWRCMAPKELLRQLKEP
ncbi:MAG TPA: hypothetical protein VKT78_17405 [Fimbriimonadaceae bacterium]|nr:hypothetical protein [Fimbriimonadaceae bacterium]